MCPLCKLGTDCKYLFFLLSGYARIILALLSFYYMPSDYIMAASMYVLSGFLDAFDGHAARILNQGSNFFR